MLLERDFAALEEARDTLLTKPADFAGDPRPNQPDDQVVEGPPVALSDLNTLEPNVEPIEISNEPGQRPKSPIELTRRLEKPNYHLLVSPRPPLQVVSAPIEPPSAPIMPVSTPGKPPSALVEPVSSLTKPALIPVEPVSAPVELPSAPVESVSTPVKPSSTPATPTSIPAKPRLILVEPISGPVSTNTTSSWACSTTIGAG